MSITTDPNRVADALGVRVLAHSDGDKGRYYGHRTISLRADLGHINFRCTLAHELAHVALRHDPAATGWVAARQEREADKWAARLLITPEAYREAELAHGPHPGAIASELEVTTHLVNVWRDHYERTAA